MTEEKSFKMSYFSPKLVELDFKKIYIIHPSAFENQNCGLKQFHSTNINSRKTSLAKKASAYPTANDNGERILALNFLSERHSQSKKSTKLMSP